MNASSENEILFEELLSKCNKRNKTLFYDDENMNTPLLMKYKLKDSSLNVIMFYLVCMQ